jgi:DNA-binding MarR family transcriptional regulator
MAPDPKSGDPRFDDDAVARLRRSITRLTRLLNEAASDEGLSPTQASVLAIAAWRGPLGLAELAEIEGLNATMLSRIVGKLDAEGLLRRTPNPADQRAAFVEGTARGREVSLRIRARRTETVTKILSELSPEVATTLLAALPALEALADAGVRPRGPGQRNPAPTSEG